MPLIPPFLAGKIHQRSREVWPAATPLQAGHLAARALGEEPLHRRNHAAHHLRISVHRLFRVLCKKTIKGNAASGEISRAHRLPSSRPAHTECRRIKLQNVRAPERPSMWPKIGVEHAARAVVLSPTTRNRGPGRGQITVRFTAGRRAPRPTNPRIHQHAAIRGA